VKKLEAFLLLISVAATVVLVFYPQKLQEWSYHLGLGVGVRLTLLWAVVIKMAFYTDYG